VNYIVMDIKLKNIYSGQCDTIRIIKDDRWMCPPLSANIILLRESTNTLHHWRRGHWQIAPNKRIHSGNKISSPRLLVTKREHTKSQINYIANDDHKWFGYLKTEVDIAASTRSVGHSSCRKSTEHSLINTGDNTQNELSLTVYNYQ